MHITSRSVQCGLIAAASLAWCAQGATAGSVPSAALASMANAAETMGPIQVVERLYRPYRSYNYGDNTVRRYGYGYGYRPRVYGWSSEAYAARGAGIRMVLAWVELW